MITAVTIQPRIVVHRPEIGDRNQRPGADDGYHALLDADGDSRGGAVITSIVGCPS